jgi:hypothetical protein
LLTDRGIYHITLLPQLQKLNLSYVGVTDHSAENIHKNCSRLQKLVITYCPISTPFLLLLKQTIPNVVKRWWSLNVLSCPRVLTITIVSDIWFHLSLEMLWFAFINSLSNSHWAVQQQTTKWESTKMCFWSWNYNEYHVDSHNCMDFFDFDHSYSWRSSMVLRKGIGRSNQ